MKSASGRILAVIILSLALAGCSVPANLLPNVGSTYSCGCGYSFSKYPDASCGTSASSGSIPGTAPTLLCESVPANAGTDCNAACAGLSTQLSSGAGCGPIATPTGSATLLQAISCNPGTGSELVIGQSVNSFVVNMDSTNSILQVVDASTGSGAKASVHGTISYTLNGAGGITLNLISLTSDPFEVDGVEISNFTITGQGPSSGTVSGNNFTFPANSILVTILGSSTANQVAEPTNDAPVTGSLDPATGAFTLSGLFKSSDFVPGTTFVATLSLQGNYQDGPPTAVAGGPYSTTDCSVTLDGSGSTDFDGSTGALFYQWFDGERLLGTGLTPTVTLTSSGTTPITLRVFNAGGEFSEATAQATTTDSSCSTSNQPPVANAGLSQTLECTGNFSAAATLDGSGSSDPDGDALTYRWTGAPGNVLGTTSNISVTAPLTPPGSTTTTYTLAVTDPGGLSSTAETNVTVQDTKPPALTLSKTSLMVVLPTASAVGVSSSALNLNQYASAADACDPNPIINNNAPSVFPIGVTPVLFTASDRSNNVTAAQTMQVQVAYNFGGYLAPVLNTGQSLFQSGRTIPVQFRLTAADGTIITNAVAMLQVEFVSSKPTGTYDFTDATSSGNSDTGNTFRFDPTSGDYVFNLSTSGFAAGTWLLRTTLNDGTHYDVLISIK